MLWLVLWIFVIVVGLLWWLAHEKQKDDDARRARDAEEAERERVLRATVAAAEPLIAVPGVDDASAAAASHVRGFNDLRTFDDVARWDATAGEIMDSLQASLRAIERLGAAMDAAIESAPEGSWARIEKTRSLVKSASSSADAMSIAFNDLAERVETTPDNKKEQAAVLRDLRAEKKELAVRKREAKASAALVRREIRTYSANLGKNDWTTYDRRTTAATRRAIRREAGSIVRPHEDEVAAIDRQINDLDRRIAWVARFGDE